MAAHSQFPGAYRMTKVDILILAYGVWSIRFWWNHRKLDLRFTKTDILFRIFWQLSHVGSMMMLIGVIYETLGFFK